MAKTAHLEAKVGAFVLLAAAVLVTMGVLLSHVRLSPGLPVQVDFAYTGALQPGAAVRLSGVKIGQVRRLVLLDAAAEPPAAVGGEPPQVRAELDLDRAVADRLREGAAFSVATAAMIGEAFLELQPGTAAAPALSGAALRGHDTPRLYEMSQQLAQVLRVAEPMVQAFERDASAPPAGAPTAAPSLGHSLGRLAAQLADGFAAHPEALSDAVLHLSRASRAGAELLAGLQLAVGPGADLRALLQAARGATQELQQHVRPLLQQGRDVLAQADALGRRANRQWDDAAVASLQRDLQAGLAQLQGLGAQGQRLLQALEQGRGTVGGLLHDPEIYDDIKELMQDLRAHPWKVLWK